MVFMICGKILINLTIFETIYSIAVCGKNLFFMPNEEKTQKIVLYGFENLTPYNAPNDFAIKNQCSFDFFHSKHTN